MCLIFKAGDQTFFFLKKKGKKNKKRDRKRYFATLRQNKFQDLVIAHSGHA